MNVHIEANMHSNFTPYSDIDKDLFPRTYDRLKKAQTKELSSTTSAKSENKRKKQPKVIKLNTTNADVIPINDMVKRMKASGNAKTANKIEVLTFNNRITSQLMNSSYKDSLTILSKPKAKGRQPTIIKNGYSRVAKDLEDFDKYYDYDFEQSVEVGSMWFSREQAYQFNVGIEDIVHGVYLAFGKQSTSLSYSLSKSKLLQVLKLKVVSRETVATLLNTYPTNSTVTRYVQAFKIAYPFIKRWSKRFKEQENLQRVA